MAYSVLGDGGVSGRLLGLNSTGANDNDAGGYFLARDGSTTNVIQRYNGGSNVVIHAAMYDDALGDVLLEADIKNGSQISKLNNANQANGTTTVSGDLSSEEFKIASFTSGSNKAAIDLEYLALFDATITDAQADSVRNYINNRNNVFSLVDGFGYYFFDPQIFPIVSPAAFVSFWGGNIVGSDNTLNASVSQSTVNDQPTRDGYTVTFNDNADHLVVASPLSGGQAGYQIVGTSLGTFAYRVDSDAVTELNLLGNAGTVRSIGDLYGIILLPASATGKDIEDARKLLIDRGAADSVSASSVQQFWQSRNDIVEFKQVDTSSVTSFREGWRFCASLEIFPPLQAPNCTNFLNAWEGNSSLNSFGAIDASSGTTFTNAWKSCSALTSFPAGAKLGTSASNVNFTSAWQASGLTSFPDIDLSKGNVFTNAWRETSLTSFSTPLPTARNLIQSWYNCNSLQSFNSELPEATNVSFAFYNNTSLTDFNTTDIKNCTNFTGAFQSCTALTSFPSDALLGTAKNNVNFTSAWQSSGLTSFSTPLPTATNVNQAWYQCASLTSFSSELQTVTSANYAWSGCTSLTSFDTPLPLATQMLLTWYNCPSLTSFSSELPSAANVNQGWLNCTSLSDFSADVFANWNPSSITSGVFNLAWDGCTSLTAQSVENILTSIDASGKYGTATGASGGGSIDSGIDIDYDGTTLSSATDSAITSLRGKSWVVYINGVERIP